MTTASTPDANSAFTLFGKMLTFSRIKLTTNDLTAIEATLNDLLSNKDSQIPIVIDSDIEQDLDALIELFWTWGLQPIGVVTGVLDEDARAKRLAIFPKDGKRIERIRPNKNAQTHQVPATTITSADTPSNTNIDANNSDTNSINTNDQNTDNSTEVVTSAATDNFTDVPNEQITSLIYDQMLRSGQSINHVGGDLILTNSINDGAEAITDNSLHIYGRAQGRIVAGATGDKEARIFCQRFNPSLVSVAGTYCLRDNIPADVIDKPVQVSYKEDEGLVFTIMNNA